MKKDNHNINEIKKYIVQLMNRINNQTVVINRPDRQRFISYNNCLYFIYEVIDKWKELEIKNGETVMIGQDEIK